MRADTYTLHLFILIFFSRKICQAYLKREINSMSLCFSFHLIDHEVINFLSEIVKGPDKKIHI